MNPTSSDTTSTTTTTTATATTTTTTSTSAFTGAAARNPSVSLITLHRQPVSSLEKASYTYDLNKICREKGWIFGHYTMSFFTRQSNGRHYIIPELKSRAEIGQDPVLLDPNTHEIIYPQAQRLSTGSKPSGSSTSSEPEPSTSSGSPEPLPSTPLPLSDQLTAFLDLSSSPKSLTTIPSVSSTSHVEPEPLSSPSTTSTSPEPMTTAPASTAPTVTIADPVTDPAASVTTSFTSPAPSAPPAPVIQPTTLNLGSAPKVDRSTKPQYPPHPGKPTFDRSTKPNK